MSSLDVPDYFTSVSGLGRLVDYFPLRRQKLNRFISLFLAVVCLLGGAVVLILGILETYDRYYKNGPAVVLKSISVPAAGAAILFILAAAGILGALRTWNRGVAIYSGGVASSDMRGVRAWRWEDVASIKVDIIHRQLSDKISSTQHTYVLVDNNGKRIILDESIARVEQLGIQIRETVMPLLLTRYSTAFQRGQTVHFGLVSLSLKDGIRIGKHIYPWETLRSASVEQGILHFVFQQGVVKSGIKGISVRAAEVPNLEVLLSLVDMKIRAAEG